ncbi:MAG: GNAT family N-acetyltransferase [Gammaproteobacteria bacterium]|nr:GNAT family N-acetyltransferase [Gammaproteobacteria bacterium]
MLSMFRSWREQGWSPIAAVDYRAAWLRFGGSVISHPDFVEKLSDLAGIEVRYLGWKLEGEIKAAVAVWQRDLALSKQGLKRHGKRRLFDLGNAEVIIPQAQDCDIRLRQRMQFVSALHEGRVAGLKNQGQEIALLRHPDDYSKKFRYNQRRELRLLEEQGGEILPFTELNSSEQAQIYSDLFEKRWGFATPGKERLAEVLELLRPFMTGSYIRINGQPAAAQILYRVESPEWISVEYINGGVDPQFNELSPGSVLTWVNTQAEWEHAQTQGKALRYSFGRADREYKDRWCHRVPVFEVK